MAWSTPWVEARPWWQTAQRAAGPSMVTVMPEGKGMVNSSAAAVTLLWQVSQLTIVPMGAAASTTHISLPSAPR